jgi:D-Tyr-tRNAtyr deacylase
MRLVVQRVVSASVSIESNGVVGAITKGLCVLIGIKEGDGPKELEWYWGPAHFRMITPI